MTILWCGGEDVDFPYWHSSAGMSTTGNRAGYSRGSVKLSATGMDTIGVSSPILGSTITSGWLSCRMQSANGAFSTPRGFIGVAKSGTQAGIFIGNATGNSDKASVIKLASDGTRTVLVEETGLSLANGAQKFDLHFTGFGGASGHVSLWVDGVSIIDSDVDLTVSGVTALDQVQGRLGQLFPYVNEIILADEDTRLMSLVTLVPSGAGDTNGWTNSYTAIDELTTDDADLVAAGSAGLDAQYALSNLPAGTFAIAAVKVAARASSGAVGVNGLQIGTKTNSTVDVGGTLTQTTAWTKVERLMTQNPVTTNNWQASEIDALQLALRSA